MMKALEKLGLDNRNWSYAFSLIDKLERLSGGNVRFLSKGRKLYGFSLMANGRVLMSVDYHHSECPSDAIDRLGGLFITSLMLQGAEA